MKQNMIILSDHLTDSLMRADQNSWTAQVDHLSVHHPKDLWLCFCRALWTPSVLPSRGRCPSRSFMCSSAGLRGQRCWGSLPEHLSELIKGRQAISELHAAPEPQADPPSSVCISLHNVSTNCFFLHIYFHLPFFGLSCLQEAWVHLCFYKLYWMLILDWCQWETDGARSDVLAFVVECNRIHTWKKSHSHIVFFSVFLFFCSVCSLLFSLSFFSYPFSSFFFHSHSFFLS